MLAHTYASTVTLQREYFHIAAAQPGWLWWPNLELTVNI